MAAPTQVTVTVANADGTAGTVVLALPAGVDALTFAQAISRGGCWDAAQAIFFPPAAIRRVTPS